MTHFIIFVKGVRLEGEPLASADSGMTSAQPESRRRPSIVTMSPAILPTTFIRLDWEMTSRRSGKTAYLYCQLYIRSARVARWFTRNGDDSRLSDIGNSQHRRRSPVLGRPLLRIKARHRDTRIRLLHWLLLLFPKPKDTLPLGLFLIL